MYRALPDHISHPDNIDRLAFALHKVMFGEAVALATTVSGAIMIFTKDLKNHVPVSEAIMDAVTHKDDKPEAYTGRHNAKQLF